MKNTNKKPLSRALLVLGIGSLAVLSSCTKDLDRFPTNGDTSKSVYDSPEKTLQAFAKVYGAYALTGNGDVKDIEGPDEGSSDFVRQLFSLQELPTETAINAWSDGGVPDLHTHSWSASNEIVRGLYYRSLYQIKLASDFLRNTESKAGDATMRTYRAEARFLRAYQYWVMIDLYGNPPFVTEATPTGKVYPEQISRADLFKYIESELKAIDGDLLAPKQAGYGRADKAAAWTLLSRLYLNAEIYTGTQRYADAAEYAEKVISSGSYRLKSDYSHLFLADNNLNNDEVILSINYDGRQSQNWGGMTYLINASTGEQAKKTTGVNMGVGGWQGNRATTALLAIFGADAAKDKRCLMKESSTPTITNVKEFNEGVYVYKFRNVTSTGANGSNSDHADTDFPLFRLAELYLNYAEAAVRGHGDKAKALQYLNLLRERAYGNNSGNYTTLPSLEGLLAERGREFYWEGQRRTDLIRFSKFVGSDYVWPWKGGVAAGKAIETYRVLYPLPSDDLQANPQNLRQNTGY